MQTISLGHSVVSHDHRQITSGRTASGTKLSSIVGTHADLAFKSNVDHVDSSKSPLEYPASHCDFVEIFTLAFTALLGI